MCTQASSIPQRNKERRKKKEKNKRKKQKKRKREKEQKRKREKEKKKKKLGRPNPDYLVHSSLPPYLDVPLLVGMNDE